LEMAGLSKDREYRIQQHYLDDEGGRLRPDVIIDLPEGRHMVIDSKVSLTSYERLCASASEQERNRELSSHVASMRNHMVALGKKDYQKIHGLETLDFVIMFVPIESAYSVAVQADPMLTQDALEKNVLIVYPSTLLMALRTIAHVWRYEYQNRNAQEIARQAGSLYDKFVGFLEDLKDVGERLNRAQNAFDSAYSKLGSGRGNLVRSAERIRELGVKPSKSLPRPLIEAAMEEE
ncbi:MAG TPA: DNA recombination protein RmuC, partial [Burkholderiales bacterium]|nr:DNA recombination protein RmuC [Burkholderiales bacterium]